MPIWLEVFAELNQNSLFQFRRIEIKPQNFSLLPDHRERGENSPTQKSVILSSTNNDRLLPRQTWIIRNFDSRITFVTESNLMGSKEWTRSTQWDLDYFSVTPWLRVIVAETWFQSHGSYGLSDMVLTLKLFFSNTINSSFLVTHYRSGRADKLHPGDGLDSQPKFRSLTFLRSWSHQHKIRNHLLIW